MLQWLQALLGDTPAVTFILWIVGIAAVVGWAIRTLYKAWPFITRFIATINSLADLPRFMVTTAATLNDQDKQIGEIHHEVHYNNGSSVKDAIARVEKGVAGLYERADGADKNTAELRLELEQTAPRNPPLPRSTND